MNINSVNLVCAITLIQAFGLGSIHSRELYAAVLNLIAKLSNNFERLNLHEFAIVMTSTTKFWNVQIPGSIVSSIGSRIQTILQANHEECI